MKTDKREIRRYLGMSTASPREEDVESLIDSCLVMLEQTARPKTIYRLFPLEWQDGFPVVDQYLVKSHNLARNLNGCTSLIIMAVTLGAGVDRLIQRKQLQSMSEAAVLQACAAAMTEAVCDELNEAIKNEAAAMNMTCHPRYSPGYGDLPLEFQKVIFSLINLPKEIGLTLNDSLLMSPAKSVTALIGLSADPAHETETGCASCTMSPTCGFSREETQ